MSEPRVVGESHRIEVVFIDKDADWIVVDIVELVYDNSDFVHQYILKARCPNEEAARAAARLLSEQA